MSHRIARWAIGALTFVLVGGLGFFPGIQETVASSTMTEEGARFLAGDFANTSLAAGSVSLARDWSEAPDLDNWTMIDTGGPPTTYGISSTYDSRNGLFVVFGGSAGGRDSRETIVYDYTTKMHTYKTPDFSPPARIGAAMAYDTRNGVCVLFGGFNTGSSFWDGEAQIDPINEDLQNETWLYNSTTNNWSKCNPANHPSSRSGHAMAYDSRNGLVVLIGGDPSADSVETWTFDVSTINWTRKASAGPSGRNCSNDLAYDPDTGVFILYGGYHDGPANPLNDTWEYDLSADTWTELHPPSTPPKFDNHNLVYDTDNCVAILFGLDSDDITYGETWIYHPMTETWSNMTADDRPVIFEGSQGDKLGLGMAYDSQNRITILYGMSGFYSTTTYGYKLGTPDHVRSGTLTSQALFLGGDARIGFLGWDATVPNNTRLAFQLRTAETSAGLTSKGFSGPDGTNTTFYGTSGQAVSYPNDRGRWIQFKAFLSTDDGNTTPQLHSVTIQYNLVIDLSILSPSADDNWTGAHDISRTASDKDGDGFSVSIYLVSPGERTLLTSGIQRTTTTWKWDTTGVQNGSYNILISVADDNALIPDIVNVTSGRFSVYHKEIGPEDPERNNQAAVLGNVVVPALVISAAAIMAGIALVAGTEVGKYGLLGFLMPLYTRLRREEVLDNETRGMIRGFIMADPGIHYNEIQRRFKLGNGHLAHHLMTLEREGFIKSQADGYLRRFYPAGMKIAAQPPRLPKIQRIIIETVQESEGLSERDIARVLDMSYSTANRHVNKLAELGLLRLEKNGMSVKCFIAARGAEGESGRVI